MSLRGALLAFVLLAFPGCGCVSILSWVEGHPIGKHEPDDPVPDIVFAGLRSYVGWFEDDLDESHELDAGDVGVWIASGVALVIEFPVSLSLDVLALPVAVPLYFATARPDMADPMMDADALARLSHSADPSLRREVAEHARTPLEVLTALAIDDDPEVSAAAMRRVRGR